jgi:hypothetical protein
MPPGISRRSFLKRAGAAAVTVAAAGAGTYELLLRSAPAPRLAAARRRTYVALVDAVGRASRSQVDPARAREAARSLEADYAAALAPRRRAIDDVLDRIEQTAAGAGGRAFSQLDATARIAAMRALAHHDDGARRDLAGRAVALAAAPFHPPAEDFHPTPVAL